MDLANAYVSIKGTLDQFEASLMSAKKDLDKYIKDMDQAAKVTIKLDTSKYQSDLSKTAKAFDKFIQENQQAISGLTNLTRTAGYAMTGLGAAVVGAGYMAFNAAKDYERLRMSMIAIAGSAAEADKQLTKIKELAKLPGLGMQEVAKAAISFQAVNMAADQTYRTIEAIGNELARTGRGRESLDGVILAFTQMIAKGKVMGDDLRQLANWMPTIRKSMLEAFGTAQTERLQEMGITAEEFISRITDVMAKQPKVADSAANAIENLKDAVFILGAELGKTLIPAAKDFLATTTSIIEKVNQWAEANPRLASGLTKVGLTTGALVGAGGLMTLFLGQLANIGLVGVTVLANLDKLKIGLAGLTAAFSSSRLISAIGVLGGALSQLGIIAGGVVAGIGTILGATKLWEAAARSMTKEQAKTIAKNIEMEQKAYDEHRVKMSQIAAALDKVKAQQERANKDFQKSVEMGFNPQKPLDFSAAINKLSDDLAHETRMAETSRKELAKWGIVVGDLPGKADKATTSIESLSEALQKIDFSFLDYKPKDIDVLFEPLSKIDFITGLEPLYEKARIDLRKPKVILVPLDFVPQPDYSEIRTLIPEIYMDSKDLLRDLEGRLRAEKLRLLLPIQVEPKIDAFDYEAFYKYKNDLLDRITGFAEGEIELTDIMRKNQEDRLDTVQKYTRDEQQLELSNYEKLKSMAMKNLGTYETIDKQRIESAKKALSQIWEVHKAVLQLQGATDEEILAEEERLWKDFYNDVDQLQLRHFREMKKNARDYIDAITGILREVGSLLDLSSIIGFGDTKGLQTGWADEVERAMSASMPDLTEAEQQKQDELAIIEDFRNSQKDEYSLMKEQIADDYEAMLGLYEKYGYDLVELDDWRNKQLETAWTDHWKKNITTFENAMTTIKNLYEDFRVIVGGIADLMRLISGEDTGTGGGGNGGDKKDGFGLGDVFEAIGDFLGLRKLWQKLGIGKPGMGNIPEAAGPAEAGVGAAEIPATPGIVTAGAVVGTAIWGYKVGKAIYDFFQMKKRGQEEKEALATMNIYEKEALWYKRYNERKTIKVMNDEWDFYLAGIKSKWGENSPTYQAWSTGIWNPDVELYAKGGITKGPLMPMDSGLQSLIKGLPKYSDGGIQMSPTIAAIAERGRPEAIVPLPNGRSIPVEMKGQGDISISVDMTGTKFELILPNAKGLDNISDTDVQKFFDYKLIPAMDRAIKKGLVNRVVRA